MVPTVSSQLQSLIPSHGRCSHTLFECLCSYAPRFSYSYSDFFFLLFSDYYPHHKHRTTLSMGMEHHVEVRQTTLKTLSTKLRKCFDGKKKFTNYSLSTANENYPLWKSFQYTKEDCEYNAIVKHFVEKCSCTPLGRSIHYLTCMVNKL